MLVLSRKSGEKIRIGDNVTVTIVRIGPNNVRLGIEAPRDLNIVREELCLRDPLLNDPCKTEVDATVVRPDAAIAHP